jgi:hypothetical protein
MPRVFKILLSAVALAGLGGLAASCGSGHTQYRIFNGIAGSAYSQGVDIQVNGATAFTSVAFKSTEPSSSGSYSKVSAGSANLEVFPAGEVGEAGDAIISSTLPLEDKTQLPQYTIVLTGSVTTGGLPESLAATQYSDDNYTIPTAGTAGFRIINGSPSTTATNGVDIYIVPPGTVLTGSLSPTVSGLTFGTASSYVYVGVPTGAVLYVYVTAPGGKGAFGYPFPQSVGSLTGGTSIRTIVLTDSAGATLPPLVNVLTDIE